MKVLEEILNSDLLTEDVKKNLSEEVENFKAELEESVRKDVEIEYAKKFTKQKAEVSKKLVAMVNESIGTEISELKEDIAKYKDLDVDYARKLNEFKEEYKTVLNESFKSFVTESVNGEIDELRSDLMEARKNDFGKRLFEAFETEFAEFGITEDVADMKDRLEVAETALEESIKMLDEMQRERKLEELLENLKGSKRELMKTLLEDVSYDKLETRYAEAIDAVLEEDAKPADDTNDMNDDTTVLSESTDDVDMSRLRVLAGT